MHIGRTPYEDKGRSQVTLLQAKVCQRLPAKQQQQEERPGPDSFLLFKSSQPGQHLDLRRPASVTARQYLSVV